ncbi:MAG: hypothetical protein HY814_04745 [Candidatus Riflebacteria bacterium]|nr:hypothetical protein [Candidatus Riflebacteria bacterium]
MHSNWVRYLRLAVAAVLLVASSIATPLLAQPKEETLEPIDFGAQGSFGGTITIRDVLSGDLEGTVWAESGGRRSVLLTRKGYAVAELQPAIFGGGKMLVVTWASGGKGKHVIPEVYRPVGGKLELVWGPFAETPLYEGEVSIEGKAPAQRLVLQEALVFHTFVPPHVTKTTTYVWKQGALTLAQSSYSEATTPHQLANLAYERFRAGEYKRSLRLYLEALEKGDFREDPELAAALDFAVAAGFSKLGDLRQQRLYLKKVTDNYPDTSYAQRAADKLLKMKAVEPGRKRP